MNTRTSHRLYEISLRFDTGPTGRDAFLERLEQLAAEEGSTTFVMSPSTNGEPTALVTTTEEIAAVLAADPAVGSITTDGITVPTRRTYLVLLTDRTPPSGVDEAAFRDALAERLDAFVARLTPAVQARDPEAAIGANEDLGLVIVKTSDSGLLPVRLDPEADAIEEVDDELIRPAADRADPFPFTQQEPSCYRLTLMPRLETGRPTDEYSVRLVKRLRTKDPKAVVRVGPPTSGQVFVWTALPPGRLLSEPLVIRVEADDRPLPAGHRPA